MRQSFRISTSPRIPAFLPVAETGSLSAAARRLRQSQPTLGRQIRALEQDPSVTLLTRAVRGLVLTESGAALLDPARAMHEAAHRLARTAAGQEAGQEAGLSGAVRPTASRVVSLHILPPLLARIRQAEPSIQNELLSSDTA